MAEMMPPPVYTPDLPDTFFVAWIQAFEALKMNPLDPLCAASNESGIRANAHNKTGNAVGLIQFMPATLKGLGYPGEWSDFQLLPADQQVPWVEKFYAPHAQWCTSPGLCYVTTFLPALVQEASQGGDNYVLATDSAHTNLLVGFAAKISSTLIQAYAWNPGFDHGRKGYITVADMNESITRACTGSRWNEVLARYNEAYAALHPSVPPASS